MLHTIHEIFPRLLHNGVKFILQDHFIIQKIFYEMLTNATLYWIWWNNSWKSRGIKILLQKLLSQEKIEPCTDSVTYLRKYVCSNFDWVMEFLTCGYKISLILPKKRMVFKEIAVLCELPFIFFDKIKLILYPQVRNSITQLTLVCSHRSCSNIKVEWFHCVLKGCKILQAIWWRRGWYRIAGNLRDFDVPFSTKWRSSVEAT